MPIDQLAFRYLDTWVKGQDFPNGLSFRAALTRSNLDFSLGSLVRVDRLLGHVRQRCTPQPDTFAGDYANRTFMLLLGFYAGTVVSHCSGREIHWYGYDELIRAARREARLPRRFATSIACILGGDALLLPLAGIEGKLFGAPGAEGVATSAMQHIACNAHLQLGRAG
jgi:hypothetical protein